MQTDDLVYGPHSVKDALDTNRVKRLWILDSKDQGKAAQFREELAERAEKAGIKIERVPRSYLDSRMGRANHQGIIAKVAPFEYADFANWLEENSGKTSALVLLLDGVQDPGNLGHILRQAVGFSADIVIIPDRRACGITPTVEKTSAGYSSRVPVAQVTNLSRTIESLQKAGFWTYALDMSGKSKLTEVEFPEKTAIVIGGEHEGVSELILQKCDEVVSIPMPGPIESFNVATSAALVMYEYRRRIQE